MSLPWRERVKVAISASRVDVVRFAAGRPQRAAATSSVSYQTEAGETQAHAIGRALNEALIAQPTRRAACEVVLSNSFVRCAILPWRDGITDRAARAAYARAFLNAVYGAGVERWEVLEHESGYGRPSAVCALERDLLQAVRGAVSDCGCRLRSVQPYFAAALNYCRLRVKTRTHWFAVVEPDEICIAGITDGHLSVLRMHRVARDAAPELASLVEREALMLDAVSTRALYVFAPQLLSDALTAPEGIETQQFNPATYLAPVGGDSRYAMALV